MSLLQIDQPLYLPAGSIRSIIALGVLSAYIFGKIPNEVALVVIGFYFGQYTDHKQAS
jgi:hypothetical protein